MLVVLVGLLYEKLGQLHNKLLATYRIFIVLMLHYAALFMSVRFGECRRECALTFERLGMRKNYDMEVCIDRKETIFEIFFNLSVFVGCYSWERQIKRSKLSEVPSRSIQATLE